MTARKLTIKEATSAAKRIIATSRAQVDVHDWPTEYALRGIGTGFSIPATAYADAEDVRTQGNLAAWLRVNAINER